MSKLYVAINTFKDLQDDGFEYSAGMIYPRRGIKASESRIKELASSKNLMGKVLIAELIGLKDVENVKNIKSTEVENTEKPKKSKSKKLE